MSKTLTPFSKGHPLQLDFCEPGHLEYPTNGRTHRKSTPYSILLTTTEGHYEIYCRDESVMVGPGEFVLIPPNVVTDFVHRDGPSGILSAHWLHFRFSLYGLVDFLSLYDTPLKLPNKICKSLSSIILQSYRLRDSQAPEALAQLHTIAINCLQLILSISKRNEAAWQSIEKSRLRPVLHYIRENLATELSVDHLAHVANLSPSRFHALFIDDFGCSPMRYVKLKRLESAARILTGSQEKLANIAEMTGFSDAFHLSHAFKAHYGMPPREYRKQSMNWNS